ncbi:hypothetical protein B5G11_02210 [Drancourtella sp. An57]|uniref:acyltransferase n=1 Tax=Drancourtella sp. An57 TaxID=1965647 RepID=UPI000B38710B|nr:acyltransferase [Drancourtella sp. An57]OUN71759.1 hypothetical protein B5G11_02210 [Drancourtella sp. An57]
MGKTQQKKRLLYIDILNILACLCVIFMHCNGIAHQYSDTAAWRQSMVIETIAYWAVPVYFMISGATLLDYRDKYLTRVFFKKRFLKTGIPFAAWTLISLAYKIQFQQMEFEPGLSSIVSLFTNTTAENVYWFFIPLFMVYLSMPVLSLLKDYKHILLYMAGLAFLVYSVYPVCCIVFQIPMNGSIQIPVAGGYILYVILGYLLATTDMTRKTRILFYILGLAGAGIRFGSTILGSSESAGLDQTFWGYMKFPAVFLAVGVFVAAKYGPWDKLENTPKILRIVTTLAGTGFGVYLMHMIVFRILQDATGLSMESGWWRLVMPFVIYGICVVLVLILKKIPVLKYIVP